MSSFWDLTRSDICPESLGDMCGMVHACAVGTWRAWVCQRCWRGCYFVSLLWKVTGMTAALWRPACDPKCGCKHPELVFSECFQSRCRAELSPSEHRTCCSLTCRLAVHLSDVLSQTSRVTLWVVQPIVIHVLCVGFWLVLFLYLKWGFWVN